MLLSFYITLQYINKINNKKTFHKMIDSIGKVNYNSDKHAPNIICQFNTSKTDFVSYRMFADSNSLYEYLLLELFMILSYCKKFNVQQHKEHVCNKGCISIAEMDLNYNDKEFLFLSVHGYVFKSYLSVYIICLCNILTVMFLDVDLGTFKFGYYAKLVMFMYFFREGQIR